jgi:hypothetical protein
MKICIIASGRCGSTSLFHCIDRHLPKFYYSAYEPFHKLKKIDDVHDIFLELNKKEGVFIKTLIGQGTERFNIKDGELINVDNVGNVEFNDWVYNTFDKIILLDRREEKLQLESMAYHAYLNEDLGWHRKKFYEIRMIPKTLLKSTKKNLLNTKNMLNDFGLKYGFKIYYYEDIFIDKNMAIINEIFDYLGIKPDKETIETYIVSEEYKVRLDKKNDKII